MRIPAPVRVGNAASEQLQIDIFGEIADAIFQGFKPGIQPSKRGEALQPVIIEYLTTVWRQPDEGIWEIRGEPRHFVHSKVMAWVAFDRAAAYRGSSRWRRAKSTSGAKSPTKSTPTFANVVLIASSAVLCRLMVLNGSTRACCCYRLLGSFQPPTPASVERFRPLSKDFSSTMSSFCGTKPKMPLTDYHPAKEHFWSAVFGSSDNYILQGRYEEAQRLFNRLLSRCNDVGLLAEEFDPLNGRMLGNFPQAYSHVGLINCALNLSREIGPTEQRATSAVATNTPS